VVISRPLADLRWHVVDGTKLRAGAAHAAHLEGAVTGHIRAAAQESGDERAAGGRRMRDAPGPLSGPHLHSARRRRGLATCGQFDMPMTVCWLL
jgi:hypothetical protein